MKDNAYAHIKRGEDHPSWKGGILKKGDGRVFVMCPGHTKANSKGYVRRCVLVAEKALGKPFPLNAVVHHRDNNSSNDKNTNLVLCENDNYHKLLHRRERTYRECGNPNLRKCFVCKEYDLIENLYVPPRKTTGSIRHKKCMYEYNKQLLKNKGE